MPSEETIIANLRGCRKYFNLDLNAITYKEALLISTLPKETKDKLVKDFDAVNPELKNYDVPNEHKLITACTLLVISTIAGATEVLFKKGFRFMIGDPNVPTFEPELSEEDKNREDIKEQYTILTTHYPIFRAIVNYLLKGDESSFETPFLVSARTNLIKMLTDLYDISIPE